MKRIPVAGGFLEILNKKELKPINAALQKHYGTSLPGDYVYMLNTRDNLYMVSRAIEDLPLKELRVSSIGLYIGEWLHGELRLSIEGSQLLGPLAQRNVADLADADCALWMQGESIHSVGDNGYVIIRHNGDFLGCGRRKDGVLLNYVPKTRRVKELAS
ncbi:hypothetical protein HY639_01095 [Candidatus Woesearchaeota archaeon]|nr:hypothetical protein [Candidatus Woesearchaeota archaeon]